MNRARLYFDFVDPLSFLVALEWPEVLRDEAVDWAWIPLELCPPPTPLVTIEDPIWADRWAAARDRAESLGLRFSPPRLVPWTRKAHELMLHAEAAGLAPDPLRQRIFEAYLLEGKDIGRVDVLVALALELPLDASETKAVLDVDRWNDAVAAFADTARSDGVSDTPTLALRGRTLRGFHNGPALRTFLGTSGTEGTSA